MRPAYDERRSSGQLRQPLLLFQGQLVAILPQTQRQPPILPRVANRNPEADYIDLARADEHRAVTDKIRLSGHRKKQLALRHGVTLYLLIVRIQEHLGDVAPL